MKTTHRVGLLISCGLLLAAGCGKKGDPVVPVIPKPQPVSAVKAHVDNRGVTLSWKIPTEYDTKAPLTLDDVRSFTIYRKTDMPVANGWNFAKNAEGWSEAGKTLAVKAYNGTLRAQSSETYLRINSPENLGLAAEKYRYIRLKLWTKNCQEGYVTFTTGADKTWDKAFNLTFDPAVHTSAYAFQKAFGSVKSKAFGIDPSPAMFAREYIIDMQSLPSWKEAIDQIGLVFKNSAADEGTIEVALDSVEFLASAVGQAPIYQAPPYLFQEDEEGWTSLQTSAFGATDGVLYAAGGGNLLLTSAAGQQLAAADAKYLRVRMRVTSGQEAYLVLNHDAKTPLAVEDGMSPKTSADVIRIPLENHDEFITYSIDLTDALAAAPLPETPKTDDQPVAETKKTAAKDKKKQMITQIGLFFPETADGGARKIAIDYLDLAGSAAQSDMRATRLAQAALPDVALLQEHLERGRLTAGMVFDLPYDEIPKAETTSDAERMKIAEIPANKLTPTDAKTGTFTFTDTGQFEVTTKDKKKIVAALTQGSRYTYYIEMTDRKKRAAKLSEGATAEIVSMLTPPQNLQAEAGDQKVTLTWTPPFLTQDGKKVRHLAEYRIFRSLISEHYPDEPLAKASAGKASFVDTTAKNGEQYFYVVQAVASETEEPATRETSNEASATPLDIFPPEIPTGLVGVYIGSAVNLHWNQAQSDDFAGFNVYRSDKKDGEFVKINPQPALNATYQDATAAAKKRYYYRVTAIDDETPANESKPSTVAIVDTYPLD